MSKASMPMRFSISLRMASVQGSAPKMPRRSLVLRKSNSGMCLAAKSTMLMAYEGVQASMVVPKSRMSMS